MHRLIDFKTIIWNKSDKKNTFFYLNWNLKQFHVCDISQLTIACVHIQCVEILLEHFSQQIHGFSLRICIFAWSCVACVIYISVYIRMHINLLGLSYTFTVGFCVLKHFPFVFTHASSKNGECQFEIWARLPLRTH